MTKDMAEPHFCGFPISVYAVRKYGLPLIQEKLSHVQYCEHGDRCEHCCFLYRGRLGKTGRIFFYTNGPKYSPRSFCRQVAFGYMMSIQAQPLCPLRACCNLWHVAFFKHAMIDEDIFDHIDVCEHGRLCCACCWKWHGKTARDNDGFINPTMRIGTPTRDINVLSYLSRHYLGNYSQNKYAVCRKCGTLLCANMWHIEVPSMYDRTVRMWPYNPRKPAYANS